MSRALSRRPIWVAIAAAYAGTAIAAPPQSPPPGGVYAIINASAANQYAISKQALDLEGVDGLLIHLRWNEISTKKMIYRWDNLDKAVKLVTAAHKRFELGIVMGGAEPAWITDPPNMGGLGAKHRVFHYDAAAAGGCNSFVMAAPFDSAYLASVRDLLRQLAAHLHKTGGYAALSMLKLDSISTTTDELRLPALAQCGGNAVQEWLALGYSQAKVENAWKAMLQGYLKYFPDKSFNIGFIGINAFPGIRPDGTAAKTRADAEAVSAAFAAVLIADAGAAMPGRLALGFDSLILNPAPNTASYLQSTTAFFAAASGAGALPGWQTNEVLGEWPKGGAACSGTTLANALPCDSNQEFAQMLFLGLDHAGFPASLRGVYLEVFPQNAAAFPAATLAAQQDLAEWPGD